MSIDVTNIRHEVAGRRILQSISLSISNGSVMALLGPNGTGKSTLLGYLAGDSTPGPGGRATMGGEPIHLLSPAMRARRRAVLTQNARIAFDFPVEEIVLMGRSPQMSHESRRASLRAVHHALELVGAGDLQRRSIRTLSGGEAQRVHLARAIAQVWRNDPHQSGYLLLDEPFSALDVAWQHEAMALLKHLADSGMGVFAILHDLNLAARYADRVAFIKGGLIAAEGPPASVMTPEIIQHVYGVAATVCPHPTHACPLIVQHGVGTPTVHKFQSFNTHSIQRGIDA